MKKIYGPRSFPRKSAGFTLMEIMIVVLIIAILAGLAMASYDWAMVKYRRAAAAGCLQENAQLMERRRTTTMSYVVDDGVVPECSDDLDNFYAVGWTAGTAPTASEFSISAVPQGRQESKDTECGTLAIDQQGVRSHSGDATSEAECW